MFPRGSSWRTDCVLDPPHFTMTAKSLGGFRIAPDCRTLAPSKTAKESNSASTGPSEVQMLEYSPAFALLRAVVGCPACRDSKNRLG